MTSAVLSAWDLWWVLPVGLVAVVLIGVAWTVRSLGISVRRWDRERAETREGTRDWLESAGWRSGGVIHDTVGDEAVRRWAEARERELRTAAYLRAAAKEAVASWKTFRLSGGGRCAGPITCADCGYAFGAPPQAARSCPGCGSQVRRHPGVTR